MENLVSFLLMGIFFLVSGVFIFVIIYVSVYPYFLSRSRSKSAALLKTLLWITVVASTGTYLIPKGNDPHAGILWKALLAIWYILSLGHLVYMSFRYYDVGAKKNREAGPRKVPVPFKQLKQMVTVSGVLIAIAMITGHADWLLTVQMGLGVFVLWSLLDGLDRRFKAQREEDFTELPTGGVLFIRSFKTEKEPFWIGLNFHAPLPIKPEQNNLAFPYFTFEEFLHDAFEKRIGPLVGLGNPRDTIPTGKGLIVYGKDEVWQQSLLRMLQTSKAVVMKVGQSDNLRWELEQIRTLEKMEKFFLFTEPSQSKRIQGIAKAVRRLQGLPSSNTDWSAFVVAMQTLGYDLPTTNPGPGSVIGFDSTGKGRVLYQRASTPEEYAEAVALYCGFPSEISS